MNKEQIRQTDDYNMYKTNFLNTSVNYNIKEYIESLKYLISLHSKTKFKNETLKAKILAYQDLLDEAMQNF